ncbi:MAG: chorismate mutase [Coriobacteriales bacterium]|jgi:chorismate mutase|nr:chorismate mutase [Coriobacteriales bacterium]
MTAENQALQDIEDLRSEIDGIDEHIVALLNQRAEKSLAIRALKSQSQLGLYDPKREEEIFARLASYNHGPLYSDDLRTIWESILRVAKEMRG